MQVTSTHYLLSELPFWNLRLDWSSLLTHWLNDYGYAAVIIVLLLCGLGLPVPEELTFILAGFTVHKVPALRLDVMIACAMVGLILGDTVLFLLGKYYGQALLTRWPFKLFFTDKRIKDAEEFFHKWGGWTILAAGFVAGVRACTYFLAASMGVKYRRFILLDFARAVLTCPISIYLGWKVGPDAEKILHQYTVPIIIVIGIVALFLFIRWYMSAKKVVAAAEKVSGGPQSLPETKAPEHAPNGTSTNTAKRE